MCRRHAGLPRREATTAAVAPREAAAVHVADVDFEGDALTTPPRGSHGRRRPRALRARLPARTSRADKQAEPQCPLGLLDWPAHAEGASQRAGGRAVADNGALLQPLDRALNEGLAWPVPAWGTRRCVCESISQAWALT